MRDRRWYGTLTDDGLAQVVWSLPRRTPEGLLRDRVLARAASREKATGWLRPALAFAALGLLIAADALVIQWQDRTLAANVSAGAPVASSRPAGMGRLHWSARLGPAVAVLHIAPLSAGQTSAPDSYLRLRRQIVNGA